MRSAAGAPLDLIGTSIFASRWPFVATMRIVSGLSSHSTPLRIGPTFLGADGERRVRDELLQIAGPDAPALVEAHRGKARELVARQAEDLEVRATAVERHALFAGGRDLHRRRRELAGDLAQLLRGNRDGARRLDVGRDLGAHGDVEVGPRQADALVGGLDQDVREHRQRGLRGNARRDRREAFLKLLPGDREPHHRSCVPRIVQDPGGFCSYSIQEKNLVAEVGHVEVWMNARKLRCRHDLRATSTWTACGCRMWTTVDLRIRAPK